MLSLYPFIMCCCSVMSVGAVRVSSFENVLFVSSSRRHSAESCSDRARFIFLLSVASLTRSHTAETTHSTHTAQTERAIQSSASSLVSSHTSVSLFFPLIVVVAVPTASPSLLATPSSSRPVRVAAVHYTNDCVSTHTLSPHTRRTQRHVCNIMSSSDLMEQDDSTQDTNAAAPASSSSSSSLTAPTKDSSTLAADVAYDTLLSTPPVSFIRVRARGAAEQRHPIDQLLTLPPGTAALHSLAVSFTETQLQELIRTEFTVLRDVRELVKQIGLADAGKKGALTTLNRRISDAVSEYRRRNKTVAYMQESEDESGEEDEAATSSRRSSRVAKNQSKKSAAAAASSSAPSSSDLLAALNRLPPAPGAKSSRKQKKSVRIDDASDSETSGVESPPPARRDKSSSSSTRAGGVKQQLFPPEGTEEQRRGNRSSMRDDDPSSSSSSSDDDDDAYESDDDRESRHSAPLPSRNPLLFPRSSSSSSSSVHVPRAQRSRIADQLDDVGYPESMSRAWVDSMLRGDPSASVYRTMKYDVKFQSTRNHRECLSITRAIDAMLANNMMLAMEILVRRAAGVHAADMSGSWDLCDVLENVMDNQSFIPAGVMQRALKRVTRIQQLKKGTKATDSTAPSSSTTKRNSRDRRGGNSKDGSTGPDKSTDATGATPSSRSSRK